MAKKINIIINPASGQPEPVLHTLNSVFHPAGVEWNVFLTRQSGDALRFASQAVEAGVDIVASYGGDGTVMEVAQGVMGSDIPMAVLPGGTANLVSVELGIPRKLAKAASLIAGDSYTVQKVDMGKVNQDYFLLRVGMGIAAEKVKIADRAMKDRFGIAAYTIAGIQAIFSSKPVKFRITLDGEFIETEGVTCLIDNAGNMGRQDLKPAKQVDMTDGLLDLLILTDVGLKSTATLAASIAGKETSPEKLLHWQASSIKIETDPLVDVNVDGEMLGQSPLNIEVMPGVVNVITPSK